MNYRELCKKLYQQTGSKYILKICEELAEFQQALIHFQDGKATAEELLDELVDVQIQLIKVQSFFKDEVYKKAFDKKVTKFCKIAREAIEKDTNLRPLQHLEDYDYQLDN